MKIQLFPINKTQPLFGSIHIYPLSNVQLIIYAMLSQEAHGPERSPEYQKLFLQQWQSFIITPIYYSNFFT